MNKNWKKGLSFGILASLFVMTGLKAQTPIVTNLEHDLDLATINYIEEEAEIVLDFDTYVYLPEDFNPYERMHFELADIIYLECEEDIQLDSRPNILFP
ncbi:MAG: hypothetical protein AAFX53_13320 [Bacteroidota bacterium]